jgi:hypothetical protein
MIFGMGQQPFDSIDVLTISIVVLSLCAVIVMSLCQDWRKN